VRREPICRKASSAGADSGWCELRTARAPHRYLTRTAANAGIALPVPYSIEGLDRFISAQLASISGEALLVAWTRALATAEQRWNCGGRKK
jgi:hypothetical protein